MWGRLDKQALENCMDVIALGLSLVMAGTGDLDTLRLLRGGLSLMGYLRWVGLFAGSSCC